ncbi:MAG: insulinase family protein [Spirochaetales bacterium]|nr:insulinase family protein [Spirochaetales bacterium]
MNTNSRFRPLIPLLFSFLVAGCQTGGPAAAVNQFAQNNLSSFFSRTLDNGIPVVVKKSDVNRIRTLSISLKGQAMFTPPGRAGIEAVTLDMLTKGSRRYSYDRIRRMLYEMSSSISDFYNSFDYSSFNLFTLDKYFDELFPIFIDCFLDPAWDAAQFDKVVNDLKIKRKQDLTDPLGLAADRLHNRFFKGHPYLAPFGGSEETLSRLTLPIVMKYYDDFFRPERIMITAVGNYDPEDLFRKLNATIGKLPKKGISLPSVPPFAPMKDSSLLLEPFPASVGVGYVRGDTPIPPPTDGDYPALLIACSMLGDIFYQKIRIEHGAAYGMWANPFAFKANYLSITIYKTTVPEKVKHYIDDSIAVMARGKCLGVTVNSSAAAVENSASQPPPPSSYVDLNDALEFYKAQYINSYYQRQETNASITSQIITSLVSTGDFKSYLFLINRIDSVTADDIRRVVKKYLYQQPKMWIVVASQDLLDNINQADYLHFLGDIK